MPKKDLKLTGAIWDELLKLENSEVIIDGFDSVYFSNTKNGIIKKDIFNTSDELDQFIEDLVNFKKLQKGELSYYFQLDNLMKVNIVLPPKSFKHPSVVITKIPFKKISLEDYVNWKVINEKEKKIIERILSSDKGILLAGNMGSGKTTLLNTIIDSIPHPRRIVTIERFPDLNIERPLLTRLQSQTQKGSEVVELISIAERMRADYVVLSECRDAEVAAYVEMVRNNTTAIALTTGESVMDAIRRLVTKLIISSDGLSLEEANYAIVQVFPFMLFQEKQADGTRIISSIAELKFDGGEIKILKLSN